VEAEFANPDRVLDEDSMPPGVSEKKLIRLDTTNVTIEIPGKVSSPGYHKFIVHYFQPENPGKFRNLGIL
jgi:hypothetical protein